MAKIDGKRLEAYIEIAELIPLPMCVVDAKGFLYYANDPLRDKVKIQLTSDFPFIGRFLESHSATRVRLLLEEISVSDEKLTLSFNCQWVSSKLISNDINSDYSWAIVGSKHHKAYAITAYPRPDESVKQSAPGISRSKSHHASDHEDKEAEEDSKIKKYRQARERAAVAAEEKRSASVPDPIALQVANCWSRFDRRVQSRAAESVSVRK